jgi:hypothetical protein
LQVKRPRPQVRPPAACSPNGATEILNYTYSIYLLLFSIKQALAGLVTSVFVGLGYYVGSKDKISEHNVVLAKDGKPWHSEETAELFKYKYHPKGNPRNAPKQVHSLPFWLVCDGFTE